MRKLFAMVATVAVVLSMFSGIAFAAVDNFRIVITSANSFVSTNDTVGFFTVTGQVYKNNVKLTTGVTNGVKVTGGAAAAATIFADGSFVYLAPTDGAPGEIKFELDKTLAPFDAVGATFADAAVVTRKASVEFSKTSFEYKANPVETVTISLKDASGKALTSTLVGGITATIVDKDGVKSANVKQQFPSTGSLLLVIDNWVKTGDMTVKLNGVAHGTITVSEIGSLGITAMPAASIKLNVPTSVSLKLTGPADLKNVGVNVTGPTGGDINLSVGTYTGGNYDLDANGEYTVEFVGSFDAEGTYTFELTQPGYKTAKATLQVVKSVAGNYEYVRTEKLSEITLGDDTITLGPDKDYELVVIKADGTKDTTKAVTYEVLVDGTAATLTPDVPAPATPSYWTLDMGASKLGEMTVRIASKVDGVKVLEKEYVVKVTGFDVTKDVSTFVVNKAQTITFTVKDKNGNAVNNAKIYVVDNGTTFATAKTGTALVDPSKTNITNGTYVKKDLKYDTVAQKTIYVTNGKDELMAQFDKAISVVGEAVLGVTTDVDTLLAGKEQTVTLTVSGLGNDTLLYAEKQVGSTITELPNPTISGNTIKVKVQNNNTKDVTVRVYNAAKDKCGEIVLKTVAPKMVFTNENTKVVTENIYTILNFKLVDPRDDSALTKEVTVSGVNANAPAVRTADKKGTLSTTLNSNSQFEVALLASGLDWDNLVKFEDTPEVKFTVPGDNAATVTIGKMEIVKASLTSDPSEVILGQPSNLTLTYKDGNGNVITGKKVYIGYVDSTTKGTEIGTTDSNGQILVANQAVSSSLKVGAATDTTGVEVSTTIPVVLDNKAPVVSAPITTDKSTATITITDNVRVTTLYVNGVKVDVIPRASITHVVTLKQGENKIDIVAIDTNYNVVEQTVTITYTPAANNSTVLQGGAVERKGDYVFVQIRQFEDLGATLTWNAAAKTATFVAGGKTVEVTVGSTTAKVNGEAATMPSAPINVGGRVMVPTRFIAEALGWTVDWAAGDIVTITLP